ncbi:MAG: glycosyltransferase family 39 protein [Planctomycetota bacterium]|jgi:hypothetical protein
MSKRTSERTVKQQENQDLLKKVTDFWVLGGLLAILLAFTLGRDINRPFYGLHSWAEAHGPWHARVHLRCGLGYTKGFATKSVGYPCTENPTRYLDHPQLGSVMTLPYYAVFGVHEWSYRLLNIILTIIALLLLLKILRGLLDDKTALLAGLFFCLFPVIGYFGVNFWLYPFTLWAIWNYLVIIKAVRDGPEPARLHKICLALALFMMLQVNWEGFFFAMAIGVHYVCRCIYRRTFPEISLLAILIIAPLASLALDFVVLAAGHNWDFKRIIALYKWRQGAAEVGKHDWGAWFAKFWSFAQTNFTVPILITAILYLASRPLVFSIKAMSQKKCVGTARFLQFLLLLLSLFLQLLILRWCLREFRIRELRLGLLITVATYLGVLLADILTAFYFKGTSEKRPVEIRKFPLFWLFLMPPIFQLFLLKGCLWRHQTWERPFCFLIAIAAAQGVMLLADIIKKANKYLAIAAALGLIALFSVYSVRGTNHYYGIRWQAPAKIEMFKKLNRDIPPDKALLSFEPFVVDQHEAKGAFYRPEIGWYLDRDIVVARGFADVQEKAKTGKYPYYLVQKDPFWSRTVMTLARQARQPNLTPGEQARREQLLRQQVLRERQNWENFIGPLKRLYKYQLVPGEEPVSKNGEFYRAGMRDYLIFDLTSKAGAP